ncbi:MAG: hypothetical protein WCA93_01745 [Acidimicrobiia bacterium]
MNRLKSRGVADGATSAGSGVIDRNRRAFALLACAGAVMSLMAILASPADAAPETFDVAIPITTIVKAAPNSVTTLTSIDVDPQFAGQICDVTARSVNPDSVHPNNNLVVSSDTSSVTIPNVEGQSGGVVDATGTLTLGSQVTVSLVMGSDGVFSAGMDVHLVCDLPVTTTVQSTTTTVASTTTTAEVLPTEVTTTTTVPTEVLPTEITTTTAQAATSTSVSDEVLDTEVLPFTGVDGGGLSLLALALFGLGAALLVTAREREN